MLGLTLTTVLSALPTLARLAGTGGTGISELLREIVGGFEDRPEEQEQLKAEIAKLAAENDASHIRRQQRLLEAARR